MNNRGQVVGQSQIAGGTWHAFLWQRGKMVDLGDFRPLAINDNGQVVGGNVLWQKGKLTDLGTLGGGLTEAVDVNERGKIVGYSHTKATDQYDIPVGHAFLWQSGSMIDLNPPGRFKSRAVAVNERGQVLIQTYRETTCHDSGIECDETPIDVRAWLWEQGKFTNLGTLGGAASTAVAMNDSGQAIGQSRTTNGKDHAFVWQNGRMTDLGTLPRVGGTYWATDINNQGQIIGGKDSGQVHGWVWEDGRMTDLGSLGSGYTQITAINERSQVVGWSPTGTSGKAHAVLWTLRSG